MWALKKCPRAPVLCGSCMSSRTLPVTLSFYVTLEKLATLSLCLTSEIAVARAAPARQDTASDSSAAASTRHTTVYAVYAARPGRGKRGTGREPCCKHLALGGASTHSTAQSY